MWDWGEAPLFKKVARYLLRNLFLSLYVAVNGDLCVLPVQELSFMKQVEECLVLSFCNSPGIKIVDPRPAGFEINFQKDDLRNVLQMGHRPFTIHRAAPG